MTAGQMSLLALAMALLSVACSGSAAAPDPDADVERPSTGQTTEADSPPTESSGTKLSERTGRFITTGRMANARKDHVTMQITDGRVIAVGVRGKGGYASPEGGSKRHESAEIYTVVTGEWTELPNMAKEREAASGHGLQDGRFLATGGSDQRKSPSERPRFGTQPAGPRAPVQRWRTRDEAKHP